MIGCLRTRVRKQPIIGLYFESENELQFYHLGARCVFSTILKAKSRMHLSCGHVSASSQSLGFILSLKMTSNFITSRPDVSSGYLNNSDSKITDAPICRGCQFILTILDRFKLSPTSRCIAPFARNLRQTNSCRSGGKDEFLFVDVLAC